MMAQILDVTSRWVFRIMNLTIICFPLVVLTATSSTLFAQERRLVLNRGDGLTLHNAIAAPVSFKGRAALKLSAADESATPAAGKSEPGTKAGQPKATGPSRGEPGRLDHLAIVDGLEFANGTIEVDLAGSPGPGAFGGFEGSTLAHFANLKVIPR